MSDVLEMYRLPETHHLQAVVYSMIEAYGPISIDGLHAKLRLSGNPCDVTLQIVRLVGAGAVTSQDGELWEVIR